MVLCVALVAKGNWFWGRRPYSDKHNLSKLAGDRRTPTDEERREQESTGLSADRPGKRRFGYNWTRVKCNSDWEATLGSRRPKRGEVLTDARASIAFRR